MQVIVEGIQVFPQASYIEAPLRKVGLCVSAIGDFFHK